MATDNKNDAQRTTLIYRGNNPRTETLFEDTNNYLTPAANNVRSECLQMREPRRITPRYEATEPPRRVEGIPVPLIWRGNRHSS